MLANVGISRDRLGLGAHRLVIVAQWAHAGNGPHSNSERHLPVPTLLSGMHPQRVLPLLRGPVPLDDAPPSVPISLRKVVMLLVGGTRACYRQVC